jgi:potassium-transporting ATPase KdpC subunit
VRRQILPAVLMMVVFTVVLGIAYPLVVTGLAQVGFADKANGSPLKVEGKTVGSKLLGQTFAEAKYFHGRPSAAGAAAAGTDATDPNDDTKTVPNDPKDLAQDMSSGSNWGPTNPDLLAAVKQRVADYRRENRLSTDTKVPVDAVTASGSGLDPEISVANARLQARRVARVRGLPLAEVDQLVDDHTDGRSLGFLGAPGVSVLELNVALDELGRSGP